MSLFAREGEFFSIIKFVSTRQFYTAVIHIVRYYMKKYIGFAVNN